MRVLPFFNTPGLTNCKLLKQVYLCVAQCSLNERANQRCLNAFVALLRCRHPIELRGNLPPGDAEIVHYYVYQLRLATLAHFAALTNRHTRRWTAA